MAHPSDDEIEAEISDVAREYDSMSEELEEDIEEMTVEERYERGIATREEVEAEIGQHIDSAVGGTTEGGNPNRDDDDDDPTEYDIYEGPCQRLQAVQNGRGNYDVYIYSATKTGGGGQIARKLEGVDAVRGERVDPNWAHFATNDGALNLEWSSPLDVEMDLYHGDLYVFEA